VFWIIVILLILGIALIFMEVFVPFGISLVCGLGLIFWSWYLCYQNTDNFPIALIWMTFSGLVAGGSVWWVWRSGMKLITLAPPDAGDGQDERPVVGDVVEVLHPLRPTGAIRWDGKRYPARSIHAEKECPKGSKVIVRGEDSIYLVVEPMQED
jgi:membrane-bound ClpP family serine protease